jgi:uncharacterized membrane protein (UPF0127 family)
MLAALLTANAAPPESPQGFAGWPRALVEIRTRGGPLRFNATVADTAERQAQGLMFVRALDADEGMWFPQRPPRVTQMWMKNTLIPLDILFVDARGRVVCVHADAVPLTIALISCPERVAGVLEIGAGQARRDGIGVGSRVELGTLRTP